MAIRRIPAAPLTVLFGRRYPFRKQPSRLATASQATHETTTSTLALEGGFPALERITRDDT